MIICQRAIIWWELSMCGLREILCIWTTVPVCWHFVYPFVTKGAGRFGSTSRNDVKNRLVLYSIVCNPVHKRVRKMLSVYNPLLNKSNKMYIKSVWVHIFNFHIYLLEGGYAYVIGMPTREGEKSKFWGPVVTQSSGFRSQLNPDQLRLTNQRGPDVEPTN